MADFLTHQCGPEVLLVEPARWTLLFDGSSCGKGSGISVILISPRGASFEFSLPIDATSTNNQAEYEAVPKGLKLPRKIKANAFEMFGGFYACYQSLIGKYDCNNDIMRIYHEECLELLKTIPDGF